MIIESFIILLSSYSLVEMFSSNLFKRILVNSVGSFDGNQKTNYHSNEELQISTIGPLLWSTDHFIVESSSSDEDDENADRLNNLQTRTSETVEMINKNSNFPELQGNLKEETQRKKRKVCPTRLTAAQVCSELCKPNVSPHLLIAPHIYGESFGAAANDSQPFQVIVHPQVSSWIYRRTHFFVLFFVS